MDADAASRPGSVLAFVRKVFFTCVWTLLFFFGSAMFLGFASGIFFVTMGSAASGASPQTMEWIGFAWAVVPMVLGLVGILLGILGYLPGTRWKTRTRISENQSAGSLVETTL
ncbi:hypothetical protein [Rubripirellula lacrimiformis]|uniref:hypothetical protein n=1 Tax=Rubripirellula lacrimiformis TaxID=1930273 RepID=UPI001C54E8D4|nr:hypothetical protein [Rubripirellula lacrimiformis]